MLETVDTEICFMMFQRTAFILNNIINVFSTVSILINASISISIYIQYIHTLTQYFTRQYFNIEKVTLITFKLAGTALLITQEM